MRGIIRPYMNTVDLCFIVNNETVHSLPISLILLFWYLQQELEYFISIPIPVKPETEFPIIFSGFGKTRNRSRYLMAICYGNFKTILEGVNLFL